MLHNLRVWATWKKCYIKYKKLKDILHTVLLFACHLGECSWRCLGQYFEAAATSRHLKWCPTHDFQQVHNWQADDRRSVHYQALLQHDPASNFLKITINLCPRQAQIYKFSSTFTCHAARHNLLFNRKFVAPSASFTNRRNTKTFFYYFQNLEKF